MCGDIKREGIESSGNFLRFGVAKGAGSPFRGECRSAVASLEDEGDQ